MSLAGSFPIRATVLAFFFVLAGDAICGRARPQPALLDLPDRLSDQQFWQLSVDLSEPGASFISDNLVSNEMSFAQVVPQLAAWTRPGGVYLGVGPEQNFTYLAAIRARMGFVIDIRRDNLLLHLLYKALFALAPDRTAFVARLFTRSRPRKLRRTSTADALMDAITSAPTGSSADFRRHLEDVRRELVDRRHFPLSPEDMATIEKGNSSGGC